MLKLAALAAFLTLTTLASTMIFASEALLDFFWIFFRTGRARTAAAFTF